MHFRPSDSRNSQWEGEDYWEGLHQSSPRDTLLDSLEIGKRVGCGGGDGLAGRLFARRGVSMRAFVSTTA